MMIWWASLVIFLVTVQVESSAVRSVSVSYLSKNGTVIFDSPEKEFYPALPLPGNCRKCVCPSSPVRCEAGVSIVTDGCGCCKICARQLGAKCDLENVCDHHKGLYCDGNTLTCKARPGRSCRYGRKWYDNGAIFSPNCRTSCTCIDGDVGCFPKCKPPPPGCFHPRLTRSAGNCCGEWKCGRHIIDHDPSGGVTPLVFRGSCTIQTTPWSPCSSTCGFGFSERVTNDNDECKMNKETRLCIIRPCKVQSPPKKHKKVCRRNIRRNKRVRYSLSGCLSTKSFRPKYCGTCRDSRKCCRPNHTKTINVEFQCSQTRTNRTESFTIKRKMMHIQSCTCGNYCSNNDLLRPSVGINLASDTLFNT